MYKRSRRNLAILPIGTVRELTLLTDRQIRYYEQNQLIKPNRGKGGQRRFSLNDVDRLLEIKDFLDAGDSINLCRLKAIMVKHGMMPSKRAFSTLFCALK
ncbi:MerR family transcriptional regulator|uniref:MerR family transcriptional regulator n=1 Tax=Leuconostoc lactis TaxID=1246 RepID=A0A6L7AAJ3_LEULA|nr:MerR family transcriptional regulator [Leuconostoc lactis]